MEYNSSVKDLEDFMKSVIWRDMVLELSIWLRMAHISLEDPNSDTEDKVLHRLGGNIETIRRVLLLPEVVRDNIKASLEAEHSEEG